MKNSLFVLLLLFPMLNVFAQNVYFGYPSDFKYLQAGDKVIINMPETFGNIRYLQPSQLARLIALLEEKKDMKIRIEINIGVGAASMCLKFSQAFAKKIDEILKSKNAPNNYELVGLGNTNPLFQNKADENFKKWHNNRIEIIIMDK